MAMVRKTRLLLPAQGPAISFRLQVVYVLHAFQKKSKKGIGTPKTDVDLIKKRLGLAEQT
jgi:hypothetical protein